MITNAAIKTPRATPATCVTESGPEPVSRDRRKGRKNRQDARVREHQSRCVTIAGRVTGRLAPPARGGLHLAVYRLRAGDLATAVKRDGQGSNP
jgi:hypothetical protein